MTLKSEAKAPEQHTAATPSVKILQDQSLKINQKSARTKMKIITRQITAPEATLRAIQHKHVCYTTKPFKRNAATTYFRVSSNLKAYFF